MGKLAEAVAKLIDVNADVVARLKRLETVRRVVRDGKDGRDGPTVEDVLEAMPPLPTPAEVAAEIPGPEAGKDGKDGKDGRDGRDGKDGKDGRDASVSDVVTAAMSQIKVPTVTDVATKVRAQVKDGRRGPQGPPGPQGPQGRQGNPGPRGPKGDSVTAVSVNRANELFLTIAGKKQKAGQINVELPTVTVTGGGGSRGTFRREIDPDNAVYVGSAEDFPNQDTSTITLEASGIYILTADVVSDKPFIVEDGVLITGRNIDAHTLTYTGTGEMFTAVNANFFVRDITLDSPNARTFDAAGEGKRFVCQTVTILNCAEIAQFGDMALVEFFNVGGNNADDGISFVGSNVTTLSIDKLGIQTTQSTFIGIDFGTCVFGAVLEVSNMFVLGPPLAIGLKGALSNANLPAGRQAMVTGTEFAGITPLDGITPQDVRWEFQNNVGIKNSTNDVDSYLTGGSKTVTVTAPGTFVEIGTPTAPVIWASDIASRFTPGADGVLTYIGEKPINVDIRGTLTIEKVGGGSDQLEARVAVDWTPGVGDTGLEKSRAVTQNATPTSVSIGALTTLNPGNNVRAILANNSGTSNIIVDVTNITITGA